MNEEIYNYKNDGHHMYNNVFNFNVCTLLQYCNYSEVYD